MSLSSETVRCYGIQFYEYPPSNWDYGGVLLEHRTVTAPVQPCQQETGYESGTKVGGRSAGLGHFPVAAFSQALSCTRTLRAFNLALSGGSVSLEYFEFSDYQEDGMPQTVYRGIMPGPVLLQIPQGLGEDLHQR